MRNLLLRQQRTQQLTLLHGGGSHQHRPALFVDFGGFVGHSPPLCGFCFVHLISPVLSSPHPVGRNDGGFKFVGLLEFHLFRFRRTGHASQAWVKQKKVLVSDRSQGLSFGLDFKGFLRLDRLVLAVAPTAARHHPTGELIHDHRFAITNDVVHILNEQLLGLKGIGDVVSPGVLGIKEIRHPQHLFGLGKTFIGEGAAAAFIHLVITFRVDTVFAELSSTLQGIGNLCGSLVFLLWTFHLTGNDQGVRASSIRIESTSSITQYWNSRCTTSLMSAGHVVPQVVETQL